MRNPADGSPAPWGLLLVSFRYYTSAVSLTTTWVQAEWPEGLGSTRVLCLMALKSNDFAFPGLFPSSCSIWLPPEEVFFSHCGYPTSPFLQGSTCLHGHEHMNWVKHSSPLRSLGQSSSGWVLLLSAQPFQNGLGRTVLQATPQSVSSSSGQTRGISSSVTCPSAHQNLLLTEPSRSPAIQRE